MPHRPFPPEQPSNGADAPPPTLVVIRPAESAGRRWMKRIAGLGGLALLAIIGNAIVAQQNVPAPSGTARDATSADLPMSTTDDSPP
ncbi:MAG TPA: hypothetical protein VJR58_28795, partial [Vineibacter sp.]|nr:hypothetical protein [Vineibacter sp.]